MPTDATYLRSLINEMQSKGVAFKEGLSDDEVFQVEQTYEFRFPPDLRALLQFALPISERFPNWRGGWIAQPIIEWHHRTSTVVGHNLVPIRDFLARPSDGICFDIEHNNFWLDEWGPKPEDLQTAFDVARNKLAQVPKLIPVYSHRFLPSEPCESGNPVFSVYQTDIICYGFDLASYFAKEFKLTCPEWAAKEPREIAFWSGLTS